MVRISNSAVGLGLAAAITGCGKDDFLDIPNPEIIRGRDVHMRAVVRGDAPRKTARVSLNFSCLKDNVIAVLETTTNYPGPVHIAKEIASERTDTREIGKPGPYCVNNELYMPIDFYATASMYAKVTAKQALLNRMKPEL